MDSKHVDANGLRFGYLEQGEGPLVLLLHGFPDNAYTWTAQLDALAAAGYRAVAPFLRGYSPTQIPDGPFDHAALGQDVRGLIEALSPDGRGFVVGHDWGGVSALAAITWHPEVVRAAVLVNTAHPVTFAPSVQDPWFVHCGFHLWYFQLEGIAEATVGAPDLRYVDYFWELWATGEHAEHIASVKHTLSQPGVMPAALRYYRDLIQAVRDSRVPVTPVEVPTLSVFGDEDLTATYAHLEEDIFKGPYFRVMLDGVKHFPQREAPERFSRLVLDWLAAHA